MTTEKDKKEPSIKPTGARGHFAGDINRNEVGMELDKFLEIINENNDLKEKVRIMESESEANPWQRWIFLSKAIDSFRPWSKAFLTVYLILLYNSTMWFMALPEPSVSQMGLISTIVGAGAAWFGLYVKSGPNDSD
jgi:hypothetical protein